MLIESHWYAIYVRSRFERTVGRLLAEKSYEQFVPMYRCRRRWSDRVKEVELPLFPNYAFCRMTDTARGRIVTTPGVIRIVGAGNQPLPVDESEIAALQQIMASGVRTEPWPFLQVGRPVQIDGGPLCGMRGVLCRIRNADRLIVSVTLLRRSVAVELDRAMVSPVESTAFVPAMDA